MVKPKKSDEPKAHRPPSTPEEDEKQMISLAVDLARQQLKDGTASPSVITHYLKLGSSRESLEQEMLGHKVELVSAQTESIKAAQRSEELYANALAAMREYTGQSAQEDEYDEY